MKKQLLIILPVVVCLLANCNGTKDLNPNIDDKSEPSVHTLNEDFLMVYKETVAIESEDLTITFSEVTEDSRCPLNVVCVWAGRVTVQLDVVYLGNEYSFLLTKGDQQQPDTIVFDTLIIKLVSVTPYPKEPGAIEKTSYVITLNVEEIE